MSRKLWAELSSSLSSCDIDDISAWRKEFKHEPLYPRTTSDPEAMFLDEAYQIFFKGVQLAREGDLAAGCAKIATAFLLDERSINFTPLLPPGTPSDLMLLAIDAETLYKMIQLDINGMGSRVLRILLGMKLGDIPGDGQTFIAEALRCIEQLLDWIKLQPEIEDEDRGILGGCCTRKRLLYIRSTFHMSMGNIKNAIKDLTRALKIDPKYTTARSARVCIWATKNLKDDTTIHHENKIIVNEYHEDNRGLDVAYAWLAITTLKDAKLGTYEDASRYYEKSKQASNRFDGIYGKRKKEMEPPVLDILKLQFTSLRVNPKALKLRRTLDALPQRDISSAYNEVRKMQGDSTSNLKHSCLRCGDTQKKEGGGKVMKCARCLSVSYCSRECQRADWKEHKVYCKVVAQPKEKITNEAGCSVVTGGLKNVPFYGPTKDDIIPKDPIGAIEARSRATWRLLTTLKELDRRFGKSCASWWHKMDTKERKEILLRITSDTLPSKEPSPSELRRKLEFNGSSGYVLFEYNIERLVGRCSCSAADCRHYHNDVILHEIHDWVNKTKEREKVQQGQISEMLKKGTFPSRYDKEIFALMSPGKEEWEMIDPIPILKNMCPKHVLDDYKTGLKKGKYIDPDIGLYTVNQRYFALGLLVKLYDEYQRLGRQMISTYPFEAIMGCSHCKRSCEGESALRCETCEVTWFCCRGCMIASGHDKCPIGEASSATVLFTF